MPIPKFYNEIVVLTNFLTATEEAFIYAELNTQVLG